MTKPTTKFEMSYNNHYINLQINNSLTLYQENQPGSTTRTYCPPPLRTNYHSIDFRRQKIPLCLVGTPDFRRRPRSA